MCKHNILFWGIQFFPSLLTTYLLQLCEKSWRPPSPKAVPPPPKKQPAIPQADIDLGAAATAAAQRWAATGSITLLWTTSAAFTTLAGQYNSTLNSRISAGADRDGHTYTLEQLDKKMNEAVEEVKAYIKKKFKTDGATAQYARYGIRKEGSNYRLPKDRNERIQALPMMLDAIDADDFGTEEFGSAFWTTTMASYSSALTASNAADSSVSAGVGSKNELQKQVQRVLRALRYVLRANYPDTYEEQYRIWGLQKEDY